jgi:streptogramin lyase
MHQLTFQQYRIALFAVSALLVACSASGGAPGSGAPPLISSQVRGLAPFTKANSNSLTYYRSPAQAPYSGNNFVFGPSNSIWYVSGSATKANQITRFTSSTTKETFTVPSLCGSTGESVPTGLANGADGRLWFGTLCGGIGAMDTTGNVQSYGLPENCSDSNCSTQLGAVSGNQIWYTSLGPGSKDNLYVGYVDTTSGTTKSYSVDAKNANLSEIIQGPDGNFWFGVNSDIGRVTPGGTITLFSHQTEGPKHLRACGGSRQCYLVL